MAAWLFLPPAAENEGIMSERAGVQSKQVALAPEKGSSSSSTSPANQRWINQYLPNQHKLTNKETGAVVRSSDPDFWSRALSLSLRNYPHAHMEGCNDTVITIMCSPVILLPPGFSGSCSSLLLILVSILLRRICPSPFLP